MLRHYRYFFYRIYCWSQKVSGRDETHAWNAIFYMAWLCTAIAYSLIMLVQLTTTAPIIDWVGATTTRKAAPYVSFLVLHMLLFLRPGVVKRTLVEFAHESRAERVKGTKLLLLYLYGPYVLFAFSIWMIYLHHR